MPKIVPHRGLLKPLLPPKDKDSAPSSAVEGSRSMLSNVAHFLGVPTVRRTQPGDSTSHASERSRRIGKLPGRPEGPAEPAVDFGRDPAYRRMNSGNPANGVVVHLPNSHLIGNFDTLDQAVNRDRLNELFASNVEVLRALRHTNAKHVFPEGTDEDSCRFYNGAAGTAAANPEFKSVCDQFAKAASAIDRGHTADRVFKSMSDKGRKWFLDMGPGAVHVILSQLANKDAPARMHITSTPEMQDKVAQIQAGVDSQGFALTTSQEKDFLYREREEFLADTVSRSDLQGEPAFVIFGEKHTFEQAFSAEGSPALYRRRLADDPEIEALPPT